MFVRKPQSEQDESKQIQRLQRLSESTPDLDAIALELRNPSLRVRSEAARLLGLVGDAGSLTPLKEALLSAYTGRSPRWHRFLGLLETATLLAALMLLVLLICGAIAFVFSCGSPSFGGGGSPLGLWNDLSEHRRRNDVFIRTVLQSLEQLVERHAAIDLRPLLPALRTIAADSHHHRDDTRSAALNTISSIQVVVRNVGDLPISSQAPSSDPAELPVVDG